MTVHAWRAASCEDAPAAYILSLILFRQFSHIQSVKGYVMCRTAEGYHSENSYAHCKERRQMQGKSDTRKSDTAHNLSSDDYDSFVWHKFQQRTPQKLQSPRDIIIEVQSAIWLSAMPSPLNISTQTILRITNGSPIAKYAEGTHFKGRLVSVFIIVAVYKACTLHI